MRNEDDVYECRTCHCGMYIPDEMDPLEKDVRYCGTCAIDEIERLRKVNKRLRKRLTELIKLKEWADSYE